MSMENPSFEAKKRTTIDTKGKTAHEQSFEIKNLEAVLEVTNSLAPVIRESEVIDENSKNRLLSAFLQFKNLPSDNIPQELAKCFDDMRFGMEELEFRLNSTPTVDDYDSLRKISFLLVDLYQSERDLLQSYKDLAPDNPKNEVFRSITQSLDAIEELSIHVEKKAGFLGEYLDR